MNFPPRMKAKEVRKTYLTNPTSSLSLMALKALTLRASPVKVTLEKSTETATAFIVLLTKASDLSEAGSRYFAVARESSVGRVVREGGKEGWKREDIREEERVAREVVLLWRMIVVGSELFPSFFASFPFGSHRGTMGKVRREEHTRKEETDGASLCSFQPTVPSETKRLLYLPLLSFDPSLRIESNSPSLPSREEGRHFDVSRFYLCSVAAKGV